MLGTEPELLVPEESSLVLDQKETVSVSSRVLAQKETISTEFCLIPDEKSLIAQPVEISLKPQPSPIA